MSGKTPDTSEYRILRRIAVGGMAEIFLAESAKIHGFRKKVVIKRILPQYANDANYVEMFLDEARLVAQLNHASIVQVFDIGQEADGVFFTMEYIEGRDLADVLGACYKRKRRLSLEEVLAIAVPTAEALHHAHELRDDDNRLVNLIHRDVSPSNVIVTNEGRVKLLDFGVAKSRAQLRATTGVSLKGKFGYMAPEQCQGLELDRRSDIFSYGVVLWELFAGRRLYPGGNEPTVLMRIMNEEATALSSVRPDLPPQLDAICNRALARDRDERYPTLQELIEDLDEFAKSTGTVMTSRTLSTLITEIFPDIRETVEMSAGAIPADRLSMPLKVSERAPSAPAAPLMQPPASVAAQALLSGPIAMPATRPRNPSQGGDYSYQTPSVQYDESTYSTKANRKMIALGSIAALAIGVALALAVSRSSEAESPAIPVEVPGAIDPASSELIPEAADVEAGEIEAADVEAANIEAGEIEGGDVEALAPGSPTDQSEPGKSDQPASAVDPKDSGPKAASSDKGPGETTSKVGQKKRNAKIRKDRGARKNGDKKDGGKRTPPKSDFDKNSPFAPR